MCPEQPRRKRRAALWTRLGLRSRVTVMFGLGALLLSVSMGYLSYLTARHFLVDERESASQHQAFVNASLVRTGINRGTNIEDLLSSADSGTTGSNSVLEWEGAWYGRTLSVGQTAIPSGVQHLVSNQTTAATQTYVYNGAPVIVVGVPLPSVHGDYYEIFDVSDLAHTIRILALALVGAGLVTTVLGAGLGRWASGRSLRPLTGVSRAAVAIAGGDLDTRLGAAAGDPDLAGLTDSFNLMVDQLQERIEREARFNSDVSHELRSPLTTLSASLAVLEGHADELGPSGRRALELLSADLRRFQRMVGDLLEISRSDSGAAEVWLEEVDPSELVRQAVAAAGRTLPPGTPLPSVEVDPALDTTRLTVDKRRFERVITNLLENAALYGGGATTVRVESGPPADTHPATVRVSVEDAGPGVAAAERNRVFERFYRGHAAFERGAGTGTGLGLALVAEHVRLQGGKVWADEAPGGGARFTIELPSDASPEEEPGEPKGQSGDGTQTPAGRATAP